MENHQFELLEKKSGYHFQNPHLLKQAMTHSSYANEHKAKGYHDNERLEFLGDAVLEVVSSEFLFRHYPALPEGDLTKLRASIVCEPTLALCARELDLGDFLLLGKGDDAVAAGVNDLCDVGCEVLLVRGELLLADDLDAVAFQNFLDTEVVDGAAEENRRKRSGQIQFLVESGAEFPDHGNVLAQFGDGVCGQQGVKFGIVQAFAGFDGRIYQRFAAGFVH